jgi:hypothetical protein
VSRLLMDCTTEGDLSTCRECVICRRKRPRIFAIMPGRGSVSISGGGSGRPLSYRGTEPPRSSIPLPEAGTPRRMPQPAPPPIGLGLSAIRAAAAAVGGFPLFAVLVLVGNEDPALYAGVGALEADVMRLYRVVVLFGRWVRGCARLCGGHWGPFPLVRALGCPTTARASTLCPCFTIFVPCAQGISLVKYGKHEGGCAWSRSATTSDISGSCAG